MLTESSTETVFEDELAAFCPPSPIVFADKDIFEPEHQLFEQEWEELDLELHMLKRNKYVGILSIAVTTLQYITISMITIFSMYIVHVR